MKKRAKKAKALKRARPATRGPARSTEVHKLTLARTLLSQTTPAPGLFPTRHGPARKEEALKKYADVLARHGGGGG